MDTKVISKLLEILLIPLLEDFAKRHNLKMISSRQQNFYPDVSFVYRDEHHREYRFALDLKSTYRINDSRVNGMTLGAFTGYFRERSSTKNITFPYSSYSGHFVLGVIYSREEVATDEYKRYSLFDIEGILSVIKDIQLFAHEKYCIASDRPGSGNTKNIGSVTSIDKIFNGQGPFASLGEEVFDDYWMHYLTQDMARAQGLEKPPYTDLESYFRYKEQNR